MSQFIMCNWCDCCSGKVWKMSFFGHRQIPCIGCLSAAVAHSWSWGFPLEFILPLFVIWWPSRLLCNMILSFLSFPKSLLKSYFPPLALEWKGLSGSVCVHGIHVNRWTWDDFWFDFSFAELILWYFLFGFRYCSLCFLVFVCFVVPKCVS